MEDVKIRLLRAGEIECRVGTVSENGLSLLLYKDARVDQKILDEAFGCFGWKRSHQSIDGKLYCTVEIWDEKKKQWIGKQDVGTGSNAEKEKGQASDSFKRACVSVGIGRELYTAPFIWVPKAKCRIQKNGEKFSTPDKFSVKEISYNDSREISGLKIVNQRGTVVYDMKGSSAPDETMPEPSLENQKMEELNKELDRTGVALDTVLKRYGIAGTENMTPEIYESAMKGLKKTKSKAA